MRITEVDVYPISVPYRVPWRNRHTEEAGRPMTHLETSVLVVRTDSGIDGLGEAKGEDVPDLVRDRVTPFLRGRDPLQISRLVVDLETEFGRSRLVAGIDFALHDIAGKALDVPVYRLLGGKFRDRVPLVWTLPYLSIEDQVTEAKARFNEGFNHAIKMKVGVPGDLDHILAVARAVPGVPVRPDSNMGHSKDEALEQYRELLARGVALELVEDPCPADWDDFQELADALGIHISVHGGWSTFDDLMDLINARKPGIRCVNVMPTEWGIFRTIQIVSALECAGIGWTMGTSHDSGIKIAASLHLGTALPNRLYPADLLGPRLFVRDVLREPVALTGGYGVAPEGPGLGVSLDPAAIKKYAAETKGAARAKFLEAPR
jgi:muconate cycloisomerase